MKIVKRLEQRNSSMSCIVIVGEVGINRTNRVYAVRLTFGTFGKQERNEIETNFFSVHFSQAVLDYPLD